MRELIFKNLIKPTSQKRDISVEEVINRDGLLSTTKKRSMYFIRGSHQIKSKEGLEAWIEGRKNDKVLTKKFFHILRRYSAKDMEDKLICKMRGSFCVISGDAAYNIVFVHAIKITKHKLEQV